MISQTTLHGLNVATFPISGPKVDPTPEDYALEAMLLREEGAAAARERYWSHVWRAGPQAHVVSRACQFYDLAKRFERVARRKSHSQRMKMKAPNG